MPTAAEVQNLTVMSAGWKKKVSAGKAAAKRVEAPGVYSGVGRCLALGDQDFAVAIPTVALSVKRG